MRFGARRRAVGKHAGERSGRRSRPPETTPQVIATPPVDHADGPIDTLPPAPEPEPASVSEPSNPEPVLVGAPAEQAASEPEAAVEAPVAKRTGRSRRQKGADRHAPTEEPTPEPEPEPEPTAYDLADVPMTSPTAGNGLLAVFKKRYLLKLLVKREISARYQGSFLGLLWSYIGPICQFFVYWFVMGQILGLHKSVENFGIHIFCGLVVVHFFTETFGAGTRSIVRNKSLVVKMALPREMFPVASMLVSLFHVFPQLVILTVACAAYGWTPDPVGMAALGLSLLIAMLLGTAGALLFSAANVFFRDFSNFVSILQMFIRFSVPMIYPYDLVDERFGSAAQYYLYNPLADAVLLVQRAFWVGSTSDPAATARTELPPDQLLWGLAMVGVGLVCLAIGQLVFSRLESKIPERL